MGDKRPIYLVESKSQYQLASTFLRFQEHYESPRFHGEVFDLETYMDWYAEQNGSFSYYEDWSGFNIPSSILTPFYEGSFNPLSRKERAFLNLFEPVWNKPCYIIGVCHPIDAPTVKHEIVHGLFYTDQAYREEVLAIIQAMDTGDFKKILGGMKSGYHESRWDDETNAYSLACLNDLIEEGLDKEGAMPVANALKAVFKKHFGFSMTTAPLSQAFEYVHRLPLLF